MPSQKSLDPGEKLSPAEGGEISSDIDTISRRRFAISLGAVALSATSSVAEQHGSDEIGSRPADLSAADWGEVQARYKNVLRVYGPRLSFPQRRMMLRILTTNQHMLSSIQSFTVQNGDPSACTLRLTTADIRTSDLREHKQQQHDTRLRLGESDAHA